MKPYMSRRPEPEVMDDTAEAEAYVRADFSEVNQTFVERLSALAVGRENATALDLGTGPADIPKRLVRTCPGWRIIALDASQPMLEFARRVIRDSGSLSSIDLVAADAKSTGLASHSFDMIFSNSILHHIKEVELFWAEVKRLAKSGATVLMRDLVRPESPEAARRIVKQYAQQESAILREEYYRSLLAAYTPDEVRGQLKVAGLGMLRVTMVSDRHFDVFGHIL